MSFLGLLDHSAHVLLITMSNESAEGLKIVGLQIGIGMKGINWQLDFKILRDVGHLRGDLDHSEVTVS